MAQIGLSPAFLLDDILDFKAKVCIDLSRAENKKHSSSAESFSKDLST